jgi:hypothetical protein
LYWAERKGHERALEERGRLWSYADLAIEVVRWSRALAASAVGMGTVIGVCSAQRSTHLAINLAAEVLDAVTLALSPADLVPGSPLLGRCHFLCADTRADDGDPPGITLAADTLAQVATLPVPSSALG